MPFQVFDAYGAASRPEATLRGSGYLFLSRGILRRAGNEKATHAQLQFDECEDLLGISLGEKIDELVKDGVKEMILEKSGAAVNLLPLLRYFGFPEPKAIGKQILPVKFEGGLIVIELRQLRSVATSVHSTADSSVEDDDSLPF